MGSVLVGVGRGGLQSSMQLGTAPCRAEVKQPLGEWHHLLLEKGHHNTNISLRGVMTMVNTTIPHNSSKR